jgi:hypothetical protein
LFLNRVSNLSLEGRMGGQASSEDLFPLGYGERDRIKVRVKINLERRRWCSPDDIRKRLYDIATKDRLHKFKERRLI